MTLTVCIPVRDRSGDRLNNNLYTLRNQNVKDYNLVIVDYGSNQTHAASINELAAKYGASVITVGYKGMWNKSHALNIALRQSDADYFMSTDVDMIYKPNFIGCVLDTVNSSTFVSCQCKYLTDNYTYALTPPINWAVTEVSCAGLSKSGAVGACFAIATSWLKQVGGWDEFYQGWGREDIDMVTRAKSDGFNQRWITDRTGFYHQYHDDEPTKQLKIQIEDNDKHFYDLQSSKVIKRNNGQWGLM